MFSTGRFRLGNEGSLGHILKVGEEHVSVCLAMPVSHKEVKRIEKRSVAPGSTQCERSQLSEQESACLEETGCHE